VWSGSDATDQLRKTIDAIAADTNRQNRTLLWMNRRDLAPDGDYHVSHIRAGPSAITSATVVGGVSQHGACGSR
jgi:hypothetical protein